MRVKNKFACTFKYIFLSPSIHSKASQENILHLRGLWKVIFYSLYQYPYYIKINELEVKPYEKDKKILISNLSLRLYAHTEPDSETPVASSATDALPLNGAETQLPQ